MHRPITFRTQLTMHGTTQALIMLFLLTASLFSWVASVHAVPAGRQVNVLPAPDAAFTLTRNGNTVTVTSNEANATAWTWDFGDGATATGRTATHTYASIATGDAAPVIRATVQGSNGCSSNDLAVVTTSSIYLPLVVR